MAGRVCVVTGATSGIGESAALALAERGARLAIVCRSPERGRATRERIETSVARECVELFEADFERLADVRRAGEAIRAAHPRIDVLLNNAGVVMLRRGETADGFETMFGVNHLAPFLLTHVLLPSLRAAPGSRIVNVSSDAHRLGALNFDDLQSSRRYSVMRAYGRSKLANILFTRELAQRLGAHGPATWALHPGAVSTRLGANNGGITRLLLPVLSLFFRTPEQGARTSIHLCSHPEIDAPSGSYFVDSKPKRPARHALDGAVAERLWRESEVMVGLRDTERLAN